MTMHDNTEIIRDHAHLLPEQGRELLPLIGLEATLALVNGLGGSTFPVPHGKNVNGEKRLALLKSVCGEDAAVKLSRRYGGTKLYIPNCKEALRHIRNIRMIKEYEERLNAGESANAIIADMAPRYRLADRNIWAIVNKTTVEQWNRSSGSQTEQYSLL